ncbi:MAG: fumarylacetoacetate hydrolase family protein [Bradyrhizobium sp.]
MRFIRYRNDARNGLALLDGKTARGIFADDARFPGELETLICGGQGALEKAADILRKGEEIDPETSDYLPVLGITGKIICLGINYIDHAKETGNKVPPHPTIFTRFPSSLIGHRASLIRPRVSTQFDYEGEMVAVIGKSGRHIPKDEALDYVCGYTIFNDASVRDYQFETTQWTLGKNFDGTGAIGPIFVTADEVPKGGKGLKIETRLNGTVVQNSNTANLIYDVATCISYFSDAFEFAPCDILVTGTPPGVGWARKPQLFLKAGDICEVEIQGLGTLKNSIADEA